MKSGPTLSLGLDSSTQSLSAVVVDFARGEIVYEKSLDYARDPRLNRYGIDFATYVVPPRQPGEADQPPAMYLASLDALFSDMNGDGVDMSGIAVINDSGQQHGHLYLSARAGALIAGLKAKGAGAGPALAARLEGCFSYGTAPIWKTSNTASQADDLRRGAGGRGAMIRLSGSDSPLRFTGAVIRRVGRQFPDEYRATETIQLISSFIPGLLTGNPRVPWDFGNGCGSSLMDYRSREWAPALIRAAAEGLPGGTGALEKKLPGLARPDEVVGTIAAYFVERYGFDPACRVCAGSGDNPQSKVLVGGDLLSLGTSFVNMVSTDGECVDEEGFANAMYDGLGRPFMFGCRTNGSLVWDRVRELNGLPRDEYRRSDATLAHDPPGTHLFLWQPDAESFPVSSAFDPVRIGYDEPSLARDYPGAIESGLGVVYLYSRGFSGDSDEPMYLTGGVARVPEIVRRVAAIWRRPVITIGSVGAALGAAVAGAVGGERSVDAETLSASVLPRTEAVDPRPGDVAAYHGSGGYLARLKREYEAVIGRPGEATTQHRGNRSS